MAVAPSPTAEAHRLIELCLLTPPSTTGRLRARGGRSASATCGVDIEVKSSWTRTDPGSARDATHELRNHVSLPADKTKVTVKNGWATLEGKVDYQYQKALAESVDCEQNPKQEGGAARVELLVVTAMAWAVLCKNETYRIPALAIAP